MSNSRPIPPVIATPPYPESTQNAPRKYDPNVGHDAPGSATNLPAPDLLDRDGWPDPVWRHTQAIDDCRKHHLTGSQAALHVHISFRAGTPAGCFQSHKNMAEDTGFDVRTVRRGILDLAAKGLLMVKDRPGFTSVYWPWWARSAAKEVEAVTPTTLIQTELGGRSESPTRVGQRVQGGRSESPTPSFKRDINETGDNNKTAEDRRLLSLSNNSDSKLKEIRAFLEEHQNHPALASWDNLGKAAGWYLKNPDAFKEMREEVLSQLSARRGGAKWRPDNPPENDGRDPNRYIEEYERRRGVPNGPLPVMADYRKTHGQRPA